MNALDAIRPRSALARRALWGGMALVSLLAVGSLDWRPERPEREPRVEVAKSARGALLAGAGRAPVKVPADLPLAGYRPFGRKAEQPGTRVHARSLVLEADGLRTALVLVELMTLPPELAAAIEERARSLGIACTFVAATHTHSGPGGYDRAFLDQIGIGRFRQDAELAILEAVSASLHAAQADLGPATVASGEERLEAASENRDRAGLPVDDRITALRFEREDGGRIASVIRFSAHPTLTPREMGPTGDWPGFAMDHLENDGGVAFLLQGAVGDVRVGRDAAPGEGGLRPLLFGQGVAAEVSRMSLGDGGSPVALACGVASFDLPPADVGAAVPWPLGSLVSNVAGPFAPAEAKVAALRIDDLVLIGVPAEPTRAVGAALESHVGAGLQGRVVGLAQGYASYAPEQRDVDERVKSAQLSWFGAGLAPRLDRAVEAVVEALPEPAVAERIAAPID